MSEKIREDYVKKAVNFLQGTISSPISKRIDFLLLRGLSPSEVLESLKRIENSDLLQSVPASSKISFLFSVLIPGALAALSGYLVYSFTTSTQDHNVRNY